MKSFVLCALIGGLVFSVGLGVQLGGLPGEVPGEPADPAVPAAPAPAAPPKRLRFPEDLAPATLSRPRAIAQAGTFAPGSKPHKVVVLKPGGGMHEWQDYFPEEWRAVRVEETELIVVVGSQKKIFVDENHFQAGPPIRRYTYEVVVSVVEPKTGQVVGYRTFRNMPRGIRHREAWETTMIGRPVAWSTVHRWLAAMANIGFPEEHDPNPLVTQTDS